MCQKKVKKNRFEREDLLCKKIKKINSSRDGNETRWEILEVIRYYPRIFNLHFQDSEEHINFADWIEEKIDTILNSYNRESSTFYIFLNKTLSFYLMNYKKFIKQKKATAYAYLYDSGKNIICDTSENRLSMENFACEKPPKYLTSKSGEKIKLWLIILGLKCSEYIDGNLKFKLCLFTEINESYLDSMIEKLREDYKSRKNKIEKMKGILFKYYVKTYHIQYQLKNLLTLDQVHINTLKNKLEYYHTRQNKIIRRLNQIKKTPSNKKIAELLNIEKSSVDYAMRVMLDNNGTGFYNRFRGNMGYENFFSQQQPT